MKYYIIKNKCFYFKCILIIILNIIIFDLYISNKKCNKKVGVIGVRHEVNVGNNLIKYAISIILEKLGYKPYIIGTHWNNFNIQFINQTTNLVIIHKDFSEVKENDYDILMVNSDQTWRKFDKYFLDYGFLRFSKNWKINKFIYGASLGYDDWQLTTSDEKAAKDLLKNFTEISVREVDSIDLVKKHFGITPTLVLDPTLLIDKKYYLDIIKDYQGNVTMKNKYLFVYSVYNSEILLNAVKNASRMFNYETYYYQLNNKSSIQDFIYYIVNSEACITNSFHGTIFSIIFNKPFLTIYHSFNAKERFKSLGNLFEIKDRLIENGKAPNYFQLIKPLNINYKLLNELKVKSINFIKKNLGKCT